jgi:uncharacterized protein (DUF58 family)
VTRSPNAKLLAYPALAALGLVAALALGRPELAALAAPFAALAAAGLALTREPEFRVNLDLDAERRMEGSEVLVQLEVASTRPVERLTVLVALPDGLEAQGPNPVVAHVGGGEAEPLALDVPVRCARWGGYEVGDILVRADDALGFFAYEQAFERRRQLKVYPGAEALGAVLRPLETQVFSGNQVARTRGEGVEFADLRPYVPGDRVRRINWRATAWRGEPWVNEAHPERNSDVVLFLDTFAEVRRGAAGTLDLAVRAAASLTAHYLAEKDRVGLVSFGGILNWLTVAGGPVQAYRIVDSLLDSEISLSYVWKGIDVIPPRTLPPRALVLALTPLVDERATGALADLRARGFDLAVIEISPLPFVESGEKPFEQLALELWLRRREALRSRYLSLGVPVVEWRESVPLQAALEEVKGFRRHARIVRA